MNFLQEVTLQQILNILMISTNTLPANLLLAVLTCKDTSKERGEYMSNFPECPVLDKMHNSFVTNDGMWVHCYSDITLTSPQ